jgi:hypothetical protein
MIVFVGLPLAHPCAAATSFYSSTSSARASSGAGIVRPSALAVARFDEIELGGLLHRDIARLHAAQNLVDVVAGAPKLVARVWTIGHEASRLALWPQVVA